MMLLKNKAKLAFLFTLGISFSSCNFISNQVLDEFHKVNDGLETSNSRQNLSNDSLSALLQKQDTGFYEASRRLRDASNNHNEYINSLKKDLIAMSGGVDSNTNELIGRDNIDVATRYLVDEGRGDTLLKKRNELKKALLAECVDDSTKTRIEHLFSEHVKDTEWSKKTFNHTPLTAAITVLTKFENDCISGEGEVLESLVRKKR